MPFLGGSSRYKDTAGLVQATYKHLLHSSGQTTSNPLRVIAHCDIDAAYAREFSATLLVNDALNFECIDGSEFEAVRIGSPDDVPLIVIQWETIIAVNYPARKYGIKRCSSMGPKEARELCPHVVIVHTATYRPGESESGYWEDADVLTHKVSLDPYRRESAKVMAIFRELVPKGLVEKASIDEAYMDITPMVLDRILERHSYLRTIPHDAPKGIDSPLPPAPPIQWGQCGNLILTDDENAAVRGTEVDEELEAVDEDEVSRRAPAARTDWGDWALCVGAEIMAEVRGQIWKRLHYTCSAGIAHNKSMAKLCSSYKKPNNQTILRHRAVPAFLRDVPFTDIRNLGGKLGRAIADKYQVETVGGLLRISLQDMQTRFGEESIWVYNIIRGVDETEINPRQYNKTMLASKNIIPPIATYDQGLSWIDLLAGELNVRLREAREIAPGVWPKTISLTWRTGYGYGNNLRSRQIAFPHVRSLDAEYIARLGKNMWKEVAPTIKGPSGHMDVHNLALQFNGVERIETGQRTIGDFLQSDKEISNTPIKAEVDPEADTPQAKRHRVCIEQTDSDPTVWICPRCRKKLKIALGSDPHIAKNEHDDWHYAVDLEVDSIESAAAPTTKISRKKRAMDIRSFMKRK